MLPVVQHVCAGLEPRQLDKARGYAERLRHAYAPLAADRAVSHMQPTRLTGGSSLLLDDLSSTTLVDLHPENVVLEQRAALRATEGDVVVTCTSPSPEFESYLRQTLGLGCIEWQHAKPVRDPNRVAVAAWTDRAVRRRLVHLLRGDRLHYFHPYMADGQVWTLARLLRSASRRPLKVIGPPPGLCRLVNDKAWFARLVRGFFGRSWLPLTRVAYNLSGLAQVVSRLARSSNTVVVKLPDSSGGVGNVLIPAEALRDRTVGAVRTELRERLPLSEWVLPTRLVVSSWRSDVLCAPSAQLWIPPEDDGLPIIEGIFEQIIDEVSTRFRGSRALDLPESVTADVAGHCQLLAVVFQHLGYMGRCSFDMILTGPDLDDCRVEFIECNGRWGGTSLPMTLMNRLLGDWRLRPYTSRSYRMPELRRVSTNRLWAALRGSLFDPSTGEGRIVLMDAAAVVPGRLDLLAVGESWSDVEHTLVHEVPRLIKEVAA